MKHIYLFALLFAFTSVSAQTNLTGATITLVAEDNATLVETGTVRVYNNSSQNYTIKTRRREGNLIPGSVNYFCWTICYGPGTNESPSGLAVNASDYNDSFHGYYDPAGNDGTSTITYVFFNQSNPNDSVWFRVNWATTGVSDTIIDPFINLDFNSAVKEEKSAVASPAYPNPAAELVSFELLSSERPEKIQVLNMLGVKVSEQNITSSQKVVIAVNELPEGVYFCNFYKDGMITATRRFTVTR